MAVTAVTPLAKDRLWTEGYWHHRGVLAEQAAGLCTDLQRLAVGAHGTVPWTGPWLTAETDAGYLPVRDVAQRSPRWQRVCLDVLQPVATILMGGPVVLAESMGIIKPPQIGQTFPLHQDGAYYGPLDGRYLIANVYLDAVTPLNGSLMLAPRSHDRALTHSEAQGKKAVPLADWPELVEPEAQAGDVVWFWLWTVHGSRPNHSDQPRRAVRIGFDAA